MSYLVMECHPGYAVLLDEEGRFLKAANLSYEVGQTVSQPVLMKKPQEKPRHALRRISGGLTAVAACFLLFFGFGYYQNYLRPYSSIYLTINPEVQMVLNRQGTVVGLAGANEDGEALIEGYDGRGKDKVTVADELIGRAIELGFLAEGGRVSFSIDSPDEVLFREYGTELRAGVSEFLDGRLTVVIEIVQHGDAQNAGGQEKEPADPSQPAGPAVTPPAEPQTPADTDVAPENNSPAGGPPPAVSDPPAGAGRHPDDGVSGYGDTDYGPANDNAAGYTPPPAEPQAPAGTGDAPGSQGVTDYTNGDTDYGPDNSAGVGDDDNNDDNDDPGDGGDDSDDDPGDDDDDSGDDADGNDDDDASGSDDPGDSDDDSGDDADDNDDDDGSGSDAPGDSDDDSGDDADDNDDDDGSGDDD